MRANLQYYVGYIRGVRSQDRIRRERNEEQNETLHRENRGSDRENAGPSQYGFPDISGQRGPLGILQPSNFRVV